MFENNEMKYLYAYRETTGYIGKVNVNEDNFSEWIMGGA